jgi:hypothetical protein
MEITLIIMIINAKLVMLHVRPAKEELLITVCHANHSPS